MKVGTMSRENDLLIPCNYDKDGAITIRRARQEDRGAIWHVHTRAIREVCRSHYSERELQIWTEVLKPDRYTEQIRKGPFYVAVEGGSIIGFGNLNQKSGEKRPYMLHLTMWGEVWAWVSSRPWKMWP